MSKKDQPLIPPPTLPTADEIRSMVAISLRSQMADPNITSEKYESLKYPLGQVTSDPAKFPPVC